MDNGALTLYLAFGSIIPFACLRPLGHSSGDSQVSEEQDEDSSTDLKLPGFWGLDERRQKGQHSGNS
jgi:hypothetical protein